MIVAHGPKREIGLDNKMPWHISEDFKHFKKTTMGHHLIMGRKTFESIGRPLPGRTTIVLTKDQSYQADGVTIAYGLDEALELARSAGDTEAFIAGGGHVYEQSLEKNLCDRIYLSLVDYNGEADAYFPNLQSSRWQVESETPHDGFLLQVLRAKRTE